jgi:hypothetical protein
LITLCQHAEVLGVVSECHSRRTTRC